MAAVLCVAAAGIFLSCEKDDNGSNTNGNGSNTNGNGMPVMKIPSEVRVFQGEAEGYCKKYYVYKLKKQQWSNDTLMGYEVRQFTSNYDNRQYSSWDFDYLASHEFTYESESGNVWESDDYNYVVSQKIVYPTIFADYIYKIKYNSEGKVAHVGKDKLENLSDISVSYTYNDEGRLDSVVYDYTGTYSSRFCGYRNIIFYEWSNGILTAINTELYSRIGGKVEGLPLKTRWEMTYEDASNLYTGDKAGRKAEVLYPNLITFFARYLQNMALIPHVGYEDLFAGKYGEGFVTDKVLTGITYKNYQLTNTGSEDDKKYEYVLESGSIWNYHNIKPSFTDDGCLKAYDMELGLYAKKHYRFECVY